MTSFKHNLLAACALTLIAGSASAATFVNGAFEAGDASGWTVGAGDRFSPPLLNPLDPAVFLPGGSRYDAPIVGHSSIISAGTVDPRVGAALGSTVYSGSYSWRVEDTTTGGYASVISQRVNNYTDPSIFFAWKAVLDGAHGAADAASMVISLFNNTDGVEVLRREYNAASGGGGVDPRFSVTSGDVYYTASWQIEEITINPADFGDDFTLSVLAADCEPTGHFGYIYLDGFGAVAPPPVDAVPEPGTLLMTAAGLLGLGLARRRKSKTA